MADFLFAGGQLLCSAGLLYGAFLCITFRPDENVRRTRFDDPLAKHVWHTPGKRLPQRLGHSS